MSRKKERLDVLGVTETHFKGRGVKMELSGLWEGGVVWVWMDREGSDNELLERSLWLHKVGV